jgi:hypothetical protein
MAIGKVNFAPEETAVGRSEFWQAHIAKFDVQPFKMIEAPAVQVTVRGNVEPTVTEPNATGLGVHAREATGAPPPTTTINPWGQRHIFRHCQMQRVDTWLYLQY